MTNKNKYNNINPQRSLGGGVHSAGQNPPAKGGPTFWEKLVRPKTIIYIVVFTLFSLYALTMIVSFFVLIINSLQNRFIYELNLGKAFSFPKKLVFENYIFAFSEMQFRGTNIFGLFFNSVWYTAICTVGPVLMSVCTGYAISKYRFTGRNVFYTVIIFSMTIPIVGTTGATFKLVSDLNIYDSPLYVVLAHLSGMGMNFLVMYGFFKNISWSYAEAAFIDGAGHFRVFFTIMLPMALPAVGALCILGAITSWNAYMEVLLYLPSWPTLASGLYGLSRTLPRIGNTPGSYAALVIGFVPVLIFFCVFADKIMRNFSVGGLKG